MNAARITRRFFGTPVDRFWVYAGNTHATDGCWEWTSTLREGYGRLWDGTRHVAAHRFAYELLVGPIPEGLQLDHLCRNRACCNPAHLEPVTLRENVARGLRGPGWNDSNPFCRNGHEYAVDGFTPWGPNGGRRCSKCRAEARRRRLADAA